MNNRLINARGVAGAFNNIVHAPDRSAIPPDLAPRIPTGHQLALFSPSANPNSPLRVEHSPWGRGLYQVVATDNGRPFGGAFTGREVDYITQRFKSWRGSVSPQEFGRVAEQVIRETQGFCYIPSDKSDRWVGVVA